ncbi:MAG: FIST C-terminal domain-containing protein [Chitinophagaceae bacterium]|nr:FIST C-terminal domain-containing protein [Chitinophagaceae bacterium]
MKAKTIKGNSPPEIQASLIETLADGFKPTLAIVFISIKQDRDAVCTLLNSEGISIFGATTSGEFITSEISEGGIVVMLLDMKPDCFSILFFETGDSSVAEISKQLGSEGKKTFSNPAFVIASGWLQTDGEEIIKGIEEGFGAEVTIFGGMAGDDLLLREPLVFTYGKKSVTGLVAIIIDENKIDIKGIATCGWKPIGITKTVTKSSGNIVYTIDDKPALDLVIKYLGLDIDLDPGKDVLTNIGAYYPLQLERENAPPVMRTAMFGNKEDRSLICAGNVPQGAKVRFSLPPDFDVIDTVVAECADLKSEIQTDADAMIMFSCISRYLSFGVMTSEEIERVIKVWNAPFIGFFSYGEFGKSKNGKHEFHNNTCCVVVLKEK